VKGRASPLKAHSDKSLVEGKRNETGCKEGRADVW
jgi:hypothetical protein